MPKKINQSEINDVAWRACDTFRGVVDAENYRNYILVMLFWKSATLEEQQHIAAILDTADQELTLLRAQRSALDQQKRGLMQRLLTGKIRVKTS